MRYPGPNGICIGTINFFLIQNYKNDIFVDCHCSGFSQSCDSIGQCLNCEGNTFGNNCEKCKDGHWRNDNSQSCQGLFSSFFLSFFSFFSMGWLINSKIGCECNGNSITCDSANGICLDCSRNTMGDHCELCIDQYFPDPNNPGACIGTFYFYFNFNFNFNVFFQNKFIK